MNDQERQVISEIFERLEQVANQPRDAEAERFINERIQRQPYAPYAMAQAIVVQEQALKNLNEQVRALQAEVEDLRSRAQSGGFLSSLFGSGAREPERPRPTGPSFGQGQGSPWSQASAPQPGMGQGGQGGPWGGQPGMGQPMAQPGMGGMMGGQPGGMFGGQQRQGSGFLGSALTTAAGVAGGMVVGNALMNAFSGSHAGSAAALGGLGGLGGASATNAGGDLGDLSPFGGGSDGASVQNAGYADPGYQDAGYDQASDFGADFGGDAGGDMGGDDWT